MSDFVALSELISGLTQWPDVDTLRRKGSGYVLENGHLCALACTDTADTPARLLLDDPQICVQLSYLCISGCEALEELNLAQALPRLRILELSRCKLKQLRLPAGCIALEQLYVGGNQLENLTFDGDCPRLELLDAANNQLKNFVLPEGFSQLAYLYLNDNQIINTDFARHLGALNTLHLRNNQLSSLTMPDDFTDSETLQALYLYGNPLPELPKEIIAKDERGNSVLTVRNYLKEYVKGTIINQRAKLILVGNGRVGKTSMYKRLKGIPFDENEPYTHGILLQELDKSHIREVETPGLQLSVWDFGGQEIFYATHQFFLSEEAIYVLAWTNRDNVSKYKERDKDALPFDDKWRGCAYWLDNIRLHGKNSPVLMVQTHSDVLDRKLPLDPSFTKEPYFVDSLDFSAKRDTGLPELKEYIAHYLKHKIPFFGKEFPVTYEEVIKALGQETLPKIGLTDFFKICQKAKISAGGEMSVLEYLNKSGKAVYFDKPLLKDVVFIDPNWLTKQVYCLINNKLEKNGRGGKIDEAYLQEVFPDYSIEDKQRFIELLKSFELIFEAKQTAEDNKPYYIAPQYLPSQLQGNEKTFFDRIFRTLSIGFVFRFTRFVPDNVMINFLSRYGPYSNKVYWRNGIYFEKEEEACVVQMNETSGDLSVYTARTPGGEDLQYEICQAFVALGKNSEASISLEGQLFANWQELEKEAEKFENDPQRRFWDCHKESTLLLSDFLRFVQAPELKRRRHDPGSDVSDAEIFFSYAWGNSKETGESLENIVNELYESLKADGLNVKRDKEEIGYKDSINEYMKRLGRGRIAIVFISDKYLKSPNCMIELLSLYRNSNSNVDELKEKIFPFVLSDAKKIYDPFDRLDFVEYWVDKKKQLEERINRIGLGPTIEIIGNDYQHYMEIANNIALLTNLFKDLNTLKPALLKENDFEIIKQAIADSLRTYKNGNIKDDLHKKLNLHV